jgi:Tfp pilus assembly PilM family ATPase
MPERILGLDIGGGSVKAVLLSRGFRGGYRVAGFLRIDIAAAGDLPNALSRLFADRLFSDALCVTALPTVALSFREIRLPFHDDRKIRKTIAFALEPVVQTPLDKVFIDYTRTGGKSQAEIFAALAPRSLVDERSALLAGYVRETVVIDIDAVPLACRLMEEPGFPESALLIDIGAQDTTVVFTEKGRILHLRHFAFGGETLTRAIADSLKIDAAEAERMKQNGALPDEAASALRECGAGLLAEIRKTQSYLLWQGRLASAPSRIILTGGGSKTPGLIAQIEAFFAVSVEASDLAAVPGIQMDATFRRSWDPALMDQALALAARPISKGRGFNFRQRASETLSGYGELRDRLKKCAVAALVILGLAGIELGLDDYGARLHLAALKRDIDREYRKIDPGTQKIIDPVAQLRGKIAEARKLSTGMGEATTDGILLDVFKEISGLAPADLLMTSFSLDGNAVVLKGEVSNFDAVETLKKAFANSKTFKAVVIGSTGMVKQGGRVEFELKMTMK